MIPGFERGRTSGRLSRAPSFVLTPMASNLLHDKGNVYIYITLCMKKYIKKSFFVILNFLFFIIYILHQEKMDRINFTKSKTVSSNNHSLTIYLVKSYVCVLFFEATSMSWSINQLTKWVKWY
jgi:hypothetical protein